MLLLSTRRSGFKITFQNKNGSGLNLGEARRVGRNDGLPSELPLPYPQLVEDFSQHWVLLIESKMQALCHGVMV